MNRKNKAPGSKETEKIIIKFKERDIKINLNKSSTAKKLLSVLPVESRVNTWGSEIYFTVPVDAKIEDGVEIVDKGTVAFWPPGKALCVFFGKTPASLTEKPRAASPVTVIGSLINDDDIEYLKKIKDGSPVSVSKIN